MIERKILDAVRRCDALGVCREDREDVPMINELRTCVKERQEAHLK